MLKTWLAAAFSLGMITAAQAQKSADTLRWASAYPIDAVDPFYNVSREMVVISSQEIWDTLIWRDPSSGEYRPLLATAWKWIDPTTLEFTLRDGVKWQDGRDFTAADVVYTLDYVGDPSHKIPIQTNVNWIKGAEQMDPHTARVHLNAPFPPALDYLSSVVPILPQDFYGANGAAPPVGKVVGTGPYRVTRFTPGSGLTVERADTFAGSPKAKAAIRRITYRTIPDNSTQIAELLSGGVDWIWNVPTDQAQRLGQAKGITVKPVETMRLSFLQMNIRDMPGGNPLRKLGVRKAVAHAIDRAGIVADMIGNGSTVPKSFCYRTQFGCDQSVTQLAYDPALAKQELAEAGYPNGVALELQAFRSRDWTDAVSGTLDAVGIRTKVDFIPYAAGQQRLARNEMQMYLQDNGWFSINDLFAVVNSYFAGDAYDAEPDPELTGWIKAAAQTNDPAARKSLYGKALNRIADQVYILPMWTHPNVHAFSSDLEFQPFPDENPRFYLARWKP